MSTTLPNHPSLHVGDCYLPRVRPRGGTLCVGVPKGDRPPTSTSATAHGADRPRKPPTSSPGGCHAAAVGVSTRDNRIGTDDYAYLWPGSEAEALEDFEAERRQLAGADDVPF